MTTKRKRPQSPKVKSPLARELTLSRRGGERDRVPSATMYKRPSPGSVNYSSWSE